MAAIRHESDTYLSTLSRRPSQASSLARRLLARVRDALPQGTAIAEEVWRRRHRGLVMLLTAHVPAIFVYSLVTGKGFGHSLFEGSIVTVACLAARFGPNSRRFRSLSVTVGFTAASAILVHLSNGLIEMHFHYFLILAAVSLYHDWAPFLTAIGFVGLQHGVMGAFDPSGVYNHAEGIAHPWKWAAIHASFVLGASAFSLVRWKSSEVEALKDPLTRLPNRALFGDRLRQAITRGAPSGGDVAVMFLDVDDFKSINDTGGHAAGDRLLIVVADRLKESVRPGDTVARLGGDEFAIVLEGVAGPAEASEVGDRILRALQAPLVFEGRHLRVSGSLGIAIRIDGTLTESDLIRNADTAMYVAKKSGKGRLAVFDPAMHQDVIERAQIASDLDSAIDNAELHLLYQPIVSSDDRNPVGFEALLRWEHPLRGTIGPVRFIPVAEETGAVVPIGRWVLYTACAEARRWRDANPHCTPWLSVNVSSRQLDDPDFVSDVADILQRSGLPPEDLILEITESAMVGEHNERAAALHRLKALGVQIALDDFGTGYSSLGYLRHLPIDIIKIDKTFIDDVDAGAENSALARAILKIADGMGMRCIAEGVEREAQAAILRASGCQLMQGFLFSKPIEGEHVAANLMWQPQDPEPRASVLLLDADPQSRLAMARRLRRAAFSVVEASSGHEALATLQSQHFDLLIVDAPLPDMHPIAFASYVRNDPSSATIPILAMSGPLDRAATDVGAFARLANAHLTKGCDEPALLASVQGMLDEVRAATA